MNCLTKEDFIFFILNDFQDDSAHSTMQKHLDICSECRHRQEILKRKLMDILKKTEKECNLVLNKLQDYIDGKIFLANDVNITDHLTECDTCMYLYQLLTRKVTLAEVKELTIPIPRRLTNSIEQILSNFQVDRQSAGGATTKGNLSEIAGALIDKIMLILQPSPAPAFLSEIISGEKEIEFSGNDVVVDVGEPGRTVKIFSRDNIEIGKQISDSKGLVIFKHFLADKYKIMVEGFEIEEIKYL